MTAKNKKSFVEFLNIIPGQKDAGLVIAKDKKEQDDIAKLLDVAGFKKAEAVYQLAENALSYIVAASDMEKHIYDFVAQYPTGQIEIFDKNTMSSNVYYPDYGKQALLVLVQKANLKKLRKNNINLLAVTGPAFQS